MAHLGLAQSPRRRRSASMRPRRPAASAADEAQWWRDACIAYFQSQSGLPLAPRRLRPRRTPWPGTSRRSIAMHPGARALIRTTESPIERVRAETRLSLATLERPAAAGAAPAIPAGRSAAASCTWGWGPFIAPIRPSTPMMPWPQGPATGASPGFRCARRRCAISSQPQDGLYTVTQSGNAGHEIRLIGAIRKALVAPEDPRAVIDAAGRRRDPHRQSDPHREGLPPAHDQSLDMAAAPVAAGSRGRRPHPIWSAGPRPGAAARASAGRPDPASCDNLADNGRQLERLLQEFLERIDPAAGGWVRRECRCPATMVDRIVPATTPCGSGSGWQPQLGCR